jgi:hypothetical protein
MKNASSSFVLFSLVEGRSIVVVVVVVVVVSSVTTDKRVQAVVFPEGDMNAMAPLVRIDRIVKEENFIIVCILSYVTFLFCTNTFSSKRFSADMGFERRCSWKMWDQKWEIMDCAGCWVHFRILFLCSTYLCTCSIFYYVWMTTCRPTLQKDSRTFPFGEAATRLCLRHSLELDCFLREEGAARRKVELPQHSFLGRN